MTVTWRILPISVRTWSNSICWVSWAYQRKNVICMFYLWFTSCEHSFWNVNRMITFYLIIFRILNQCEKLKFIDLSFCVHLDDAQVNKKKPYILFILLIENFSQQIAIWKEKFDVTIKRSFVRTDHDYSTRSYNIVRNFNWTSNIR